jgi:hypothetical protein
MYEAARLERNIEMEIPTRYNMLITKSHDGNYMMFNQDCLLLQYEMNFNK